MAVRDGAFAVEPAEDGIVADAEGMDGDDVRRFLGFETDLDEVLDAIVVDGPTRRAVARHRGLRLLNIPPWHWLVGFLARQRSTVDRTTAMVRELCERHGEPAGERAAHRVPPPERVADLRTDGLEERGFRDVVALDTRIRSIGDEPCPWTVASTYRETSERSRRLFSPHTGYAQTYLYHDAYYR